MNVVHFHQYKQGGLSQVQLNETEATPSQTDDAARSLNGTKSYEPEFDVFKEFSRLDVPRKMALFDCIMLHRGFAYRNMMKNIWPHSNENDARALEMMLNARLNRLKRF